MGKYNSWVLFLHLSLGTVRLIQVVFHSYLYRVAVREPLSISEWHGGAIIILLVIFFTISPPHDISVFLVCAIQVETPEKRSITQIILFR